VSAHEAKSQVAATGARREVSCHEASKQVPAPGVISFLASCEEAAQQMAASEVSCREAIGQVAAAELGCYEASCSNAMKPLAAAEVGCFEVNCSAATKQLAAAEDGAAHQSAGDFGKTLSDASTTAGSTPSPPPKDGALQDTAADQSPQGPVKRKRSEMEADQSAQQAEEFNVGDEVMWWSQTNRCWVRSEVFRVHHHRVTGAASYYDTTGKLKVQAGEVRRVDMRLRPKCLNAQRGCQEIEEKARRRTQLEATQMAQEGLEFKVGDEVMWWSQMNTCWVRSIVSRVHYHRRTGAVVYYDTKEKPKVKVSEAQSIDDTLQPKFLDQRRERQEAKEEASRKAEAEATRRAQEFKVGDEVMWWSQKNKWWVRSIVIRVRRHRSSGALDYYETQDKPKVPASEARSVDHSLKPKLLNVERERQEVGSESLSSREKQSPRPVKLDCKSAVSC